MDEDEYPAEVGGSKQTFPHKYRDCPPNTQTPRLFNSNYLGQLSTLPSPSEMRREKFTQNLNGLEKRLIDDPSGLSQLSAEADGQSAANC